MGLVLCFVAGFLLTVVIPFKPLFKTGHSLKVSPVPSSKIQSSDFTLRLASIATDAIVYEDSSLSRLCSNVRGLEDTNLILFQNYLTSLTCDFYSEGEIRVRLEVINWSGKVKLTLDNSFIVKESFSPNRAGFREVEFPIQEGKKKALLSWFLRVVAGSMIGLCLFFASSFLIVRNASPPKANRSKVGCWFLFTSPIISGWALYLLAFWPAIMSPDSRTQWDQVLRMSFSDWHPVFHTLTIWLITRLWLSPTAVAIAQILAMAALIGWILARHYQRGMPVWLHLVILGLLLLPPYGLLAITIWKDIAYSIAILGFTLCILLIAESKGEWMNRRFAWPTLGVLGALVALYRHNGAPAAFGTMLILLIVYRKNWRPFTAGLILTSVIWLGVKGPLYQVLNVDRASRNPGLGLALTHLIARHTQSGTEIQPQERILLKKVRGNDARWPYNCYWNNDLVYDRNLNIQSLRDNTYELGLLALRLTFRNPLATFKHLACNSSLVARITHPPNFYSEHVYETVALYIAPDFNDQLNAFAPTSLWPKLREEIYNSTNKLFYSRLSWFFWRAPFWMYLLLFSTAIAAIRSRNAGYFLIAVPVLLSTVPLAFFTFVQTYRFVFPMILVSLLFSGYLLTAVSRQEPTQNP